LHTGAVCDQKTSKFFVSHREEAMLRHVGVNGVYLKLGKANTSGRQEADRAGFSSPGAFKTYGKGRTR
jgi:hypothetical protein